MLEAVLPTEECTQPRIATLPMLKEAMSAQQPPLTQVHCPVDHDLTALSIAPEISLASIELSARPPVNTCSMTPQKVMQSCTHQQDSTVCPFLTRHPSYCCPANWQSSATIQIQWQLPTNRAVTKQQIQRQPTDIVKCFIFEHALPVYVTPDVVATLPELWRIKHVGRVPHGHHITVQQQRLLEPA